VREVSEQWHGHVVQFDSTTQASHETNVFANLSHAMFHPDELWRLSSLRFFIVRDVMLFYNFRHVLHLEADNLLYWPLSLMLPDLHRGYGSEAVTVTPLFANLNLLTASVMWIPNIASLDNLASFLLKLARNDAGEWTRYLKYVRSFGKFSCCIKGGVDPDERGMGLKHFIVSEMTMLSYYHYVYGQRNISFFPVLPTHSSSFNHIRYTCNMTSFSLAASQDGTGQVGPPVKFHTSSASGSVISGIWDPGSWGQWLGGTEVKLKRNSFADFGHIVGQAIRTSGCLSKMLCSNVSLASSLGTSSSSSGSSAGAGVVGSDLRCFTAPYAVCDSQFGVPTPLFNLHVHSKATEDFVSTPCQCTS